MKLHDHPEASNSPLHLGCPVCKKPLYENDEIAPVEAKCEEDGFTMRLIVHAACATEV